MEAVPAMFDEGKNHPCDLILIRILADYLIHKWLPNFIEME